MVPLPWNTSLCGPNVVLYSHAISTLHHVQVLLYGKWSGMAGFTCEKVLLSHTHVSLTDTSMSGQLNVGVQVNSRWYLWCSAQEYSVRYAYKVKDQCVKLKFQCTQCYKYTRLTTQKSRGYFIQFNSFHFFQSSIGWWQKGVKVSAFVGVEAIT